MRSNCVVGCGAGPELPHLVEALGGDGVIDGIDLSPALIVRAEQRRQAEGWTNVRLQVADAGKFVAAEPYDGVLFAFSLIAMSPYHEDVLRHMWGYVAPGGCMTVMDSRMPWFLRWVRPLAQRYVNRTYLGDMRIRPKECLSACGVAESGRPSAPRMRSTACWMIRGERGPPRAPRNSGPSGESGKGQSAT